MDISTKLERLQAKKIRSELLVESLKRLKRLDAAAAVQDCGTYIGFGEGGKILEANFCKHRLCPMCGYRRSLKIYANSSKILDKAEQMFGGQKYLFLTLTVRSCPIRELGQTLDDMAAGFKRLINNRAWKSRVNGCMRTLEITIDEAGENAHPHYHLILAVDQSYGRADDIRYWTTAQWGAAWAKAGRLGYNPVVWIERIKGGREKGLAETAKYLCKDTDYLIPGDEARTDRIVDALCDELKGRRLIAYTGYLRKAQSALKIDPEGGDLTDSDTIRADIDQVVRRCYWSAGLRKYTGKHPMYR